MPLRNSLPERDALRTRSYGIRSILDIRAIDEGAVLGQDRGADAEARVGTVGCGFGCRAAFVKSGELGGG